jgi:hypothetical protein
MGLSVIMREFVMSWLLAFAMLTSGIPFASISSNWLTFLALRWEIVCILLLITSLTYLTAVIENHFSTTADFPCARKQSQYEEHTMTGHSGESATESRQR